MAVERTTHKELLSIIAITLLSATGLSCALLLATSSYAESATAGVTVGSACTMTATINTAHTAEVPASSSKENIGSTELKTTCNDNGGFAVYAVGFSNNEYGNNKMLGANSEFNTGTATSGANSNWSMKLSQITTGTYATAIDGTFGAYSNVPATFTKVAHRDASTDDPEASSATGSSIALTYGAYIASTQAPGDYTGKVKFTLVHPSTETPAQPQPATAGCINYFANASNAEGTMGCQSVDDTGATLADGASVTLLASNFSRIGYGFAGWSDKYDYSTNSFAHFYGPNETITVPTGTAANGLSIYAVWVKSAGNLQDTNKVAELCGTGTNALITAPTDGTANLKSVSALTDQRDNNTYAIAKLADGKCWMIENLRLESTAEHNSDGALAEGYGTSATYGNFGGLAGAESSGFTSTYTANNLYYSGTQEGTASIDIGTSDYPAYRMPRYNNLNTSTRASNPTNNSGNMYSYGNYYTWHAAIANLSYNGTNNRSTTGTSLCPAGWHLPKGGNKSNEANNALWSLVVDGINGGTKPANYDSSTAPFYTGTPEGSDASNKLRAYPNNYLYSGSLNASSTFSRGSYGYYWSSTAGNYSSSYNLLLHSSNVGPGTDTNSKPSGRSIRCSASS